MWTQQVSSWFLATFDQDDFFYILQSGPSIGCLRFWREWPDTHLVCRFSLICHVPTLQKFPSTTIQQLPQQLVKYWTVLDLFIGCPLGPFGGEFLLVAAAFFFFLGSLALIFCKHDMYDHTFYIHSVVHVDSCWFTLILLDILFADWIENLRRRWRKRDRMRQINMIRYECAYHAHIRKYTYCTG